MGSHIKKTGDLEAPSKGVCEALVTQLEASSDYVVLRRFSPVERYSEENGCSKQILMVVDTETTGLDCRIDVVFELGYVLAEFCPKTGIIFAVVDRYSGFEDPGFSLTPEITRLTGVCDEDVRGRHFDNEKIIQDIRRADIIVAQNAKFDRNFVELVWPDFKKKPWACSIDNGPWAEMGVGIKKQEFLAMTISRVFYDAHRALTDSEVLLDILSHEAHDGRTILHHVVENSRVPVYRVWASNAPFEKKEFFKLKAGFSWSDGTESGKLKAWFKDRVQEQGLDAVLDLLAENVYAENKKIEVDMIDAYDRFSPRITTRTLRNVRRSADVRANLSAHSSRVEIVTKSPIQTPKKVLVLSKKSIES